MADPAPLISKGYRALLREMYRTQDWGGSGHKRAPDVLAFAAEIGARTVLDYGCGQGLLKKALAKAGGLRVAEYDPGIAAKAAAPEAADLVACTDVLEHIERDYLDNVLRHLRALSLKGLYLQIATRRANKVLPDGRNAHLIVETGDWWLWSLKANGIEPQRVWSNGRELRTWLRR